MNRRMKKKYQSKGISQDAKRNHRKRQPRHIKSEEFQSLEMELEK